MGEKLQGRTDFFCEANSFAYRKSNNFLARQAHRPRRSRHFPYVPARRISGKEFLFSEIFLFPAIYFFLLYKKVFFTNFVTHITNFVTRVSKFVTHISKFVTNFSRADSEN